MADHCVLVAKKEFQLAVGLHSPIILRPESNAESVNREGLKKYFYPLYFYLNTLFNHLSDHIMILFSHPISSANNINVTEEIISGSAGGLG